ncbi:urease accessory protein UreF [Spirosoma endbachense]|uniref:Urease accessory protein UreF n=1 Tax=Spirosoma endbachense TaxID=2666025 RepID=A0A6P1VQ05_9BACT|nr:urease accessory protein UreF [Spirosoma endbachense]QHV94202.1 urease accessory protein UreF [Spirosoma endbachense]
MNTGLIRLLQLSDPTLPIGGYAHSAGLETYVQAGVVHNVTTAKMFVEEMLGRNLFYTDAALASLAYDAATRNDWNELVTLDDECTAVKLPKEMRQASQKLGIRLMKLFQPLCDNALANQYREAIQNQEVMGHYCLVFGLFAQALQIPKADAMTGFYYNAAGGMVTNCVKLVPLGQQDGQEILFSLHPLIQKLVTDTLQPNRELIGLCCPGFDIRSMQHEQLYSRLYMS